MGTRRIDDDAQGRPRWIRSRYNPAEHTVPADFIQELRANSAGYSAVDLLRDREGPLAGFMELARFERDGKEWVRLKSSREWMIELELTTRNELGEIRAVPPEEAWRTMRELDAQSPTHIAVEGEDGPERS